MTPVVALESGTAKIQVIFKVELLAHNVYPSPRNPGSWDERCGNGPLWTRKMATTKRKEKRRDGFTEKSLSSSPVSISRRLITAEGDSPPQLDVPEHWPVRDHISTRVSIPAGKLLKQYGLGAGPSRPETAGGHGAAELRLRILATACPRRQPATLGPMV